MGREEEIIEYWFGDLDDPENKGDFDKWFGKDPTVDDEIRQRFSDDLERAGKGEYDSWMASPRSCLALIVLTDQFPRNMFRDSPKAFSFDEKAKEAAEAAVERGFDEFVPVLGRLFMYLPFEHSEKMEDQERSVELFTKLKEDAPASMSETMDEVMWYADRHHEIIKRFGRFPHRNNVLGRKTTEEEEKFLKEPGSSF